MQTTTKSSRSSQEHIGVATQADAWFEQYRFHDGEILPHLRIHYSTLGSPHRNAQGQIDNAVLVIVAFL
jgi:homoserine acetyltransferase